MINELIAKKQEIEEKAREHGIGDMEERITRCITNYCIAHWRDYEQPTPILMKALEYAVQEGKMYYAEHMRYLENAHNFNWI